MTHSNKTPHVAGHYDSIADTGGGDAERREGRRGDAETRRLGDAAGVRGKAATE